jgi:hypothetical protein
VIAIPRMVRVFLGTQPQDFRKSIDGLSSVVISHLERDPLTGDVFVFHNRGVYSGVSLSQRTQSSQCRALEFCSVLRIR